MNKREMDVLLAIVRHGCTVQRELAAACGYSLGGINASVKTLIGDGYITEKLQLTQKATRLLRSCTPQRAVLLAAGLGIQQGLNRPATPKALLSVNGQRLIERLIQQLQQVNITQIYVVVGFAKEQFEYLIDQYGVELIVNSEYLEKNNLHSLALAKAHLNNCYVVPCDLWCEENPFRPQELYSWYMVSNKQSLESSLRINRKQELTVVPYDTPGHTMVGISYLLEAEGAVVASRLSAMDADRRYKGSFWEETLYQGDRFLICPLQIDHRKIAEINTLKDLENLNDRSAVVARAQSARLMKVPESRIRNLTLLKKGMTNTSFSFSCDNRSYCIRIPTEKTDPLIDRVREASVYALLADSQIPEPVCFFDPDTGIKISRLLEGMRSCDIHNRQDVFACMQRLREVHNQKYQLPNTFDLFKAIEFYESLWNGESLYPDYSGTKQQVFSLQEYIAKQPVEFCLSHLDAVPENFLIPNDPDSTDAIRLIDWEYAAMQDPHMDIAMFCLQSLYDKEQTDAAIDAYFPEGCSRSVRLKIYCYMAAGGLLWSNWCEYEIRHGAEFGAYSLRQYRYAKEYCKYVQSTLDRQKEDL